MEHRFVIENIYEEDAHIKSVTSSCQCSKPSIAKRLLKTWEKTEIVVTVDTRAEPGRKDGTIEVEFDLPFPAKVQLHVHSLSAQTWWCSRAWSSSARSIKGPGQAATLKITYAGRNDWKIMRVECANPNIQASAAETSRTPGPPSNVAYKLSVELEKTAPPGYIREPLMLVTNDADAKAARVPVNIEGLVSAALMVRPTC